MWILLEYYILDALYLGNDLHYTEVHSEHVVH